MTPGFNGIIAQLERQKAAIERALAALREIEGGKAETAKPAASEAARPAAGEKPNRRSEGQKARWAAKKAAGDASPSPAKSARKTRVTTEGRKRLAEAMKRRWAVKRAGAAAKKTTGR